MRGANGKEWSLEVLRTVASVTKGDQVTLFWGIVGGKDSDWLSVYNHSTEHLGFVGQTTAKLAGPPLYTVMLFGCGVIQFFALFGMVQWSLSAWIAFLLFSVPWAWVFQRRATLKKAVRDAIPRPGQASRSPRTLHRPRAGPRNPHLKRSVRLSRMTVVSGFSRTDRSVRLQPDEETDMEKHCGMLERVGNLTGGELYVPVDRDGYTQPGAFRVATQVDSIKIGSTILKKPRVEDDLFPHLQPGREACLYVVRMGRAPVVFGVNTRMAASI